MRTGVALLLVLGACTDRATGSVVQMDTEATQAARSVALLQRCEGCHSISTMGLTWWRQRYFDAPLPCIEKLTAQTADEATAAIDCMRSVPSNPQSRFRASKLGLYAAAAHLPIFARLFDLAFGESG